jgi:hypothetical protein
MDMEEGRAGVGVKSSFKHSAVNTQCVLVIALHSDFLGNL